MSSNTDRNKWNATYRSATKAPPPAYILQQFQHLLPQQGKALDLACGLGANALLLAQHGLQTHAWDISSTAINKLTATATTMNLNINTQIKDISDHPPQPNTFNVIVVSHFLQRKIMPNIIAALCQNGLLLYQTFTKTQRPTAGPTNPAYRLSKNELLSLCKDLDIIIYQELGLLSNNADEPHNQAILIAQRTT